MIPRYASDRNGAFEAYLPDGSTNYVLRQQVDSPSQGLGGAWNRDRSQGSVTAGGSITRRASTSPSRTAAPITVPTTPGWASASRARYNGAPYLVRFTFDGGWQLLVNNSAVASGNVVSGAGGVRIGGFNTAYNAWHNIALKGVGNTVTAYLDGVNWPPTPTRIPNCPAGSRWAAVLLHPV